MPRRTSSSVNQPLVDFLLTLVPDLGENLQRTVKKAARNLQSHPTPILTKQDALSVHGIGQWIATQIEVYIANNSSEFPAHERLESTSQHQDHVLQSAQTSIRSQVPSAAVVLNDDTDDVRPSQMPQSIRSNISRTGGSHISGLAPLNDGYVASSDENDATENQGCDQTPTTPSTRSRNGSRLKRKRPYRPGYRTAPFAILIALREGLMEDKTSMKKSELAGAAQQYCDAPILAPHNEDRHTWFDGWSCVNKTLIKKGLVAKSGSPAKFQLTIEGQVLANSLAVEYLSAQRRTLTSCGEQPAPSNSSCPPERPGDTSNLSVRFANSSPVVNDTNEDNLLSSPLNSPAIAPSFIASISNEAACATSRVEQPVPRSRQAISLNTNIASMPGRSTPLTPLVAASNNEAHETVTVSSGRHFEGIQLVEKDQPFAGPDINNSTCQNFALDATGTIAVNRDSFEQIVQTSSIPALFLEQAQEYLHSQYNAGNNFGSMFTARARRPGLLLQSQATQQTVSATASAAPASSPRPSQPVERNVENSTGQAALFVGAPPLSSQRSGSVCSRQKRRPAQKRFSDVQVERAVRVLKRLTSYSEELCLSVLAEVFEKGDFPRTDDKLYEVLSNQIWEKQKEGINDASIVKFTELHTSARSTVSECSSLSDADGSDRIEPIFLRPNTACSVSKGVIVSTEIETINLESPEHADVPGEIESSTVKEESVSNDVINIEDESDNDSVIVLTPSVRASVRSPPVKRPRSRLNTDTNGVGSDPAPLPADGNLEDDELESQADSLNVHDDENFDDFLQVDLPPVTNTESCTDVLGAHDFTPDIAGDVQRSVDMSVQATAEGPRVVLDFRANQEGTPRENQCENEENGRLNAPQCKVLVILDKMERFRNRSNQRWQAMAKLLEEAGAVCDGRALPCGDAIFVAQYEDGCEVVLDYIVERKTVEDFASSVYDGRVSRQAYMMRQSKINNRMFVIEGDLKENSRVYDNPEVHKKLAELEVCEDFYVKYTKDLMDTVCFYASLRRRLQQKFEKSEKVELLDNRSLFTEWMDRMKKLTRGLTLEQLFTMQLCQIPGVGESKARAILNRGFDTPQKLYRAYQHAENVTEREELLKGTGVGGCGAASRTVYKLFNNVQYGTTLATSSRSRSESARK